MYAKKCSLSPHFLDDHVRPLASFPGLRLQHCRPQCKVVSVLKLMNSKNLPGKKPSQQSFAVRDKINSELRHSEKKLYISVRFKNK